MKYLKACLVGLGIWGAATPSVATHFFLSVDPVTGLPALFVGSGVGKNSPGAEPPGRGGRDESPIQLAQVVQLDSETTAAMIAQTLAGSDVIAALLQNKAALDAENAAFMAALNQSLGGQDESSGDLVEEGLRANMNELVASIIGAALASTTVTEEEARALIEARTGVDASRPPATPPLQSGGQASSELEARQRELREQAEQRRQQQAEQVEQQREQTHQKNQELIAKIEEQRRQQEEANKRQAEERKRAAEEALKEKLSAEQRRALEERQAQREAGEGRSAQEQKAQENARLRERLLAESSPSPRDPGEPATPESFRDHIASVPGDIPADDAAHDGAASPPAPGQTLDDVHTDFANQQERDDSFGETAQVAWEDFLMNRDGPVTEAFPSESIYGQASGTYNGLVRGEFEQGVAANGTIQMNISFTTQGANGVIRFDDNQGNMQFEGWVGDVGFEIGMEGNAFGGEASGYLYGQLYGPSGEEVGGDWGMHVYDGDFAGQSASGRFAAKQ